MSDHDPLCPHDTHPFPATCETCILLAKVRADERAAIMSRVAQDMTVDREKWTVLARSTSLADLRAQVETLRAEDPHNQPVRDAYDAVIALLGSSDE